jgi:glycosyltransferase involved in cell wall biosynthesis
MANARPVIATAVGGVVDLLGPEISAAQPQAYTICQRGISVRSNDPPAFAAGLARIIGDPALRNEIGERSLQFVERNYSKERLLHDIGALYRELLQPESVAVKGRSSKQSLESKV